MISDCPPCICNDSNTMRNTLFGLTGLGSAIICRVFWGAIKRYVNLLWKKITEKEVPDAEGAKDGREDGGEDGREDGREYVPADN